VSQFFTDYHEARHAAVVEARTLGLPVALRATTEYGKHGFVVRLLAQQGRRSLDRSVPVSSATWHLSDSDELKAEVVRSGDWATDWCACPACAGCRGDFEATREGA